MNSIFNFLDKISEEEFCYFDGPIFYPEGINERIEQIFQSKKAILEADKSISGKENTIYFLKQNEKLSMSHVRTWLITKIIS